MPARSTSPRLVRLRRWFVTPALLAVAAAAVAAPPQTQVEDHGFGPVDPVPVPNVMVTRHDGARVRLPELMRGRRTAVQFVFMDCKTACPLLGSLFENVDKRLGAAGNVALLSITVNPERDTPERLTEWLKRHHASPRWTGVRADVETLRQIRAAFSQQEGPPSGHSMQVFFVDREATYVGRSLMLPQAARVANALLGKVEMAGRVTNAAETPEAAPVRRNDAPSGELIYTGVQPLTARVSGDLLNPAAAVCSNCHGAGRQGTSEGKLAAPSLAAQALLVPRPRRGGPASAYQQASFCDGLRKGIDPSGVMYSQAMPRYEMTAGECRALWEFLAAER